MDHVYICTCAICRTDTNAGLEIALSDKIRDRVLRRIYDHFDVGGDIDPDLFAFTLGYLDEAVEDGADLPGWGDPDPAFLRELKNNNAVFAAFKTHRQQNDLAVQLLDENGDLRPFPDFRKATEPIIGAYNSTWLKTEHETAIKSARTTVRFKTFEKDRDLRPNLKWLRSRAVTPRDAHKPYYNTIRSMSDPWWETHYPGCVYGCQCDFKSTGEPITHRGYEPVATGQIEPSTSSPGLDRNPAMTGSIFSDSHPYITGSYAGAREAVAGFLRGRRGKRS